VIFTDADTLAFGQAYISDDAYESPSSELKFEGATITASTGEAWEEFRKNGPPNVVSKVMWWQEGKGQPPGPAFEKRTGNYPRLGLECYFARRLEIQDMDKARIRAVPSYRADAYWTPSSDMEFRLAQGWMEEGDDPLGLYKAWYKIPAPLYRFSPGAVPFEFGHYPNIGTGGVTRRDGLGPVLLGKDQLRRSKTVKERPVPVFFPATSPFASGDWPRDKKEWRAKFDSLKDAPGWNFKTEGERSRGFAYCWRGYGGEIFTELGLDLETRVGGFTTVDGKRVYSNPPEFGNFETPGLAPQFYFGDRYFFLPNALGLGSGDI
jgi:hypothetical protein